MLAGLIAPSSGSVRIGGELLSAAAMPRGSRPDRIPDRDPRPLGSTLRRAEPAGLRAPLRRGRPAGGRRPARSHALQLRDRRTATAPRSSPRASSSASRWRARCCTSPAIVLLDEPTSGLDPESARDVRALIRRGCATKGARCSSPRTTWTKSIALPTGWPCCAADWSPWTRLPPCAARLFGARVAWSSRQPPSRSCRHLQTPGSTTYAPTAPCPSACSITPSPRAGDRQRDWWRAGADVQSVVAEEASLEEVYLRLLRDDESATQPRERVMSRSRCSEGAVRTCVQPRDLRPRDAHRSLAILLPFFVAIIVPAFAGERLSDSSDFEIARSRCPAAIPARAASIPEARHSGLGLPAVSDPARDPRADRHVHVGRRVQCHR